MFNIRLQVQVVMASSLGGEGSTQATGLDPNDPIFSTGLELGAEIRRLNQQNS